MFKIFRTKIFRRVIASGLVMVICMGSLTITARAAESTDLQVVDVGHGEYRLVSDASSVNASIAQASSNVKSLKQIRNGIFQIDGTKEKLLKVNDISLLKVGELNIDVTNKKDMSQLRSSKVSEAMKEQAEAFAADCEKNPSNDPRITIYSPNLLEAPKTTADGQVTASSSIYFYYTGTGGYTYKQEFWTCGIRYSEAYNKTYNSGYEAIDAVKAICNFTITKGVSKIGWGTPYSVINLVSSILKPLFAPENVNTVTGTLRVVQAKEYSGELRFCYIRQNLGNGMQDYLKARSSSSSLQWLERLCVINKNQEDYVVNEPSYTGEYFNTLDQMAYAYRTSTAYYDTVRYSITHEKISKTFNLFPSNPS